MTENPGFTIAPKSARLRNDCCDDVIKRFAALAELTGKEFGWHFGMPLLIETDRCRLRTGGHDVIDDVVVVHRTAWRAAVEQLLVMAAQFTGVFIGFHHFAIGAENLGREVAEPTVRFLFHAGCRQGQSR